MSRRRAALVGVVLALATVAGCSYRGADSLPLPGTVGGADTYTVTVTFRDATNLVPKETCRTNDTVVGSVVSVDLDSRLRARVVCRIKDSVHIPGNVVATLRETSLLGERFVGLDLPPGVAPRGRLGDDARIPTSATVVTPDTEVVLGALSQVLNGGSLGSIATVSRELITALNGRTGTVRQAAARLATTLASFDANRQNLVYALDQLDRFSATLNRQRSVIAGTLQQLPRGLAVLGRERPRLTAALQRIDSLSGTVVPLIRRSKTNTVADLRHLRPTLFQLARAGDELALSLERLASFPFNANTLYTIKGDYSGAYVQANFDLDSVNQMLRALLDQGGGPLPAPTVPGGLRSPRAPGLPAAPGMPGLPGGDLSGLQGRTIVPGEVTGSRPATLADLLRGP